MIVSETLLKYLRDNKAGFEMIKHSEAFTAQEVAHAIHKTGKVLAKTVIVEADGKPVMVVVPAHHRVNIAALKAVLGAKEARLSSEEKLRTLFPDCDLGAMPPLGALYNMQVVVSSTLTEKPEIVFNACTHTDCIKISTGDFRRLASPTVADVSEMPPEAL